MKIGLLECDHVAERYQEIGGDYRDMFAALLARHAPGVTLQSFDVCNGQWPGAADHCDSWICTGSRFSVYDDVEWIHRLKSFVRQLRETRQPFVGICFGHQILAEVFGGHVARAPAGWGVGVHRMELIHPEPWMQPLQSGVNLQFMHQDQVLRLPPGARLLANSDHCPIAMFRVDDTMLGIQAHPEFPREYSDALLVDRAERIGVERAHAARESLIWDTEEDIATSWIREFLRTALGFRTRKLA
ncbi:MAG: type 1 glutamine amidotransferase [Blastocatellia bacterium]